MERIAEKFALPIEWVRKYYRRGADLALGSHGIFREESLEIFTYMRPKLNELRLQALKDRDNLTYCAILRAAIIADDREAIAALGAPNKQLKDEFYDTLPVFSLLASVSDMVEKHRRMGIPEDVTRDTLGMFENQLQDFIDLNHRYGISAYTCWMDSFIRVSMVRVGRFNLAFGKHFSPYEVFLHEGELVILAKGVTVHESGRVLGSVGCTEKDGAFLADTVEDGGFVTGHVVKNCRISRKTVTLPISERVLRQGDAVVDVHIPSGGRLTPEICDADLARGEEIMWSCFGEFNAFVCHSWLLDAELEAILGESTNITKFGDRFTRYPIESSGNDVYEYVFMQPSDTPIDELNVKTSFAQTIKNYLMTGGYIYGAGGVFLPRRKK